MQEFEMRGFCCSPAMYLWESSVCSDGAKWHFWISVGQGHSLSVPNASCLGVLAQWGELCKCDPPEMTMKAFVKERHHCKVQPSSGDFHQWHLCLVAMLCRGTVKHRLDQMILGSQSTECSCRVISVLLKHSMQQFSNGRAQIAWPRI